MKSIVICGNGPSLADVDLRSLMGVATLGMNAAYRYWDRIDWYPDIYCCLDDRVAVSHQDQIVRLIHDRKCRVFFLHHSILQRYPGLAGHDNCFFLPSFDIQFANTAPLRGELGIPILDPTMFWSRSLSKVTTGAYSLRFAAALGFTDILLLGIDARYVEVVTGAKPDVGIGLKMEETPAFNPNYFFSDYQQEGDLYNLPTPPTHEGNLHSDVFQAIREDFEICAPHLNILVGSRDSELCKQGIFEFKSVDAFLESVGSYSPVDGAELLSSSGPGIPSASIVNSTFSGFFFIKDVSRTGPDSVEWAPDASQNSSFNAILGGRLGFSRGTTVEFSVTLCASSDCVLSLEAARFGDGDFENIRKDIALPANTPVDASLAITLKYDQKAIKFAISPKGSVPPDGLRLSYEGLSAD